MDGALVMNIKSGWIYDNIKIINTIGGKSKGEVLILDDRENFIDFGGKEGLSANPEFRQELMAHGCRSYSVCWQRPPKVRCSSLILF